jgi:hypothetical protein
MAHKYDGQLAYLKNHTEESARTVAKDINHRVTATESKFTQELEKLDYKIRIIPALVGRAFGGATRSASSKYNDDHGVMHGELYYMGAGAHAWCVATLD